MSYKSWFENHNLKHKNILKKITHLSDDEIIKYFNWENLSKKEPDFCPLFKQGKKCHDIENLNCYMCGCSNFRLKKDRSFCSINSKYGKSIKAKDGFIHQDCSSCVVPHKTKFIKQNFSKSWKKMMEKVL
jgi:hypothetical protein